MMEQLVYSSPKAWCEFQGKNYLRETGFAERDLWNGSLEEGLSDGRRRRTSHMSGLHSTTVAFQFGPATCKPLVSAVGASPFGLGNTREQKQFDAWALPAIDHPTLTSSYKIDHSIHSSTRSLCQNIRVDAVDGKETTMPPPITILPFHIKSSEPPLEEVNKESNNLESASTRTEYSQYDPNGSDAESPAQTAPILMPTSQTSGTNAISLLPSEPTTPITSPLPLSRTPYKLLAAHHPTVGRLYKIESLPGKGLGMRATAHIPSGTRLLAETPVLAVHRRDWVYETTQREAVISMYLSLPQPYVELYDALTHTTSSFGGWHAMVESEYSDAQPFGPDDPPRAVPFDGFSRIEQARVMAILSTNAFGVDGSRNGIAAAICPEASRINHSCTPNMQFAWNDNVLGGAITMHATRDIAAGEEITAGYIDLYKSSAARQEILRENYGFDCTCVVCGAGADAVRLSDCRREMMNKGLRMVRVEREDEPWRRSLSGEAGEILDGVVKLHEEEGMLGLNFGNVFNLGIARGDRYYMHQYLTVLLRCVGTDHKWTKRLRKQMAELDEWEVQEKAEAEADAALRQQQKEEGKNVREVVRAESSKAGAEREEVSCEEKGGSRELDSNSTPSGGKPTDLNAARPGKSPNAFIQQLPRFKQTARKSTGFSHRDQHVDDEADDDYFDDDDHDDDPLNHRKESGRHAGGDEQEDDSGGEQDSDEDSDDEDEWDQFDTVTITRRGVSRTFRLVPIDDELDGSTDGGSRRRVGRRPATRPYQPRYVRVSDAKAARKRMASYQRDSDNDNELPRASTSQTPSSPRKRRRSSSSSPPTTPIIERTNATAAARTGYVPSEREMFPLGGFSPNELREINERRRANGLLELQTARKSSGWSAPPCPWRRYDERVRPSTYIPSAVERAGGPYMPAERRAINARRVAAGLMPLQTATKSTGRSVPASWRRDDDDDDDDDDEEYDEYDEYDEDEEDEEEEEEEEEEEQEEVGPSTYIPSARERAGPPYNRADLLEINTHRVAAGLRPIQTATKSTGWRAPSSLSWRHSGRRYEDEDESDYAEHVQVRMKDGRTRGYRPEV